MLNKKKTNAKYRHAQSFLHGIQTVLVDFQYIICLCRVLWYLFSNTNNDRIKAIRYLRLNLVDKYVFKIV